ncbi:RDD family protein [Streptomyces sp. NPDC006704]|uniref:RDD family protein n=1 Tax=Streptomyces sp. NPDC006704 TaxID=3364760 RepID=UPI0036784E15
MATVPPDNDGSAAREGYYPDPSIPGYVRYWNGVSWVPGTSRPAPAAGEAPPSPPPGAQPAPAPSLAAVPPATAAPAAEETGPVFLDEPEPSAAAPGQNGPQPAWHADAAHQSGFGGDQDCRVSWGLPAESPDPRVPDSRLSDPRLPDPRLPDPRRSGTPGPVVPEQPRPGHGSNPGHAANPAHGSNPAHVSNPERAVNPGHPAPSSDPGPSGPAGAPAGARPGGSVPHQHQHPQPHQQPQPHHQHAPQPIPSGPSGPPGPSGPFAALAGPVPPAAVEPAPARAQLPRPADPLPPAQPGPAQPAPVQQQLPAAALPGSPMAAGAGGGAASWAQQVHQLAQPDSRATEPVAPWKPPVADPFLAAAQAQAAARPAGLGRRLGARLIDTAVLGVVAGGLALPLLTRVGDHIQEKIDAAKLSGRTVTVYLLDGTTASLLGIVLGAFLVLGLLYEALPTAKWGRTLGKRICGVEVRGIESFEPPTFGQAARRWVVYGVLGLLVVGVVNVVWCLFDRPWRQCWHDKVAHTFVAQG